MKKFILLFSLALLTNILLSPTIAADIFEKHEKMIWIDQLKQVGAAYEDGKKVQLVLCAKCIKTLVKTA
jgi:hypothetical protein